MNQRCCENVFDGWHHHPCSRKGVIERDGKWYCKQHDPEAVKARRAASDAKWNREWAITRARGVLMDAKTKLTAACIEREPAELRVELDAVRAAQSALDELVGEQP